MIIGQLQYMAKNHSLQPFFSIGQSLRLLFSVLLSCLPLFLYVYLFVRLFPCGVDLFITSLVLEVLF